MFLSDKYHSGNQQFSTGGKCERRWKTILPSMPVYAAESMAAVDNDGNLYFGCHSGIFYSLDGGGRIRWSFHTTEKIYGSPLITKNVVIASTGDGLLICFHKHNGEVKWIFDLKKGYYSSKRQRLLQTAIHLPFTFSFIRKMNMDTKCWSSPLLIDDKIFITSFGKGFYCINAESGSEEWSVDLGYPRFHLSGAVADDENFIYFGSRSGNFYKYDVNGNLLWQIELGGSFWGAPSYSVEQEFVILPSSKGERRGKVHAINKRGEKVWTAELASAIYGSMVNKNGIGYCCDFAGYLYKMDLTNGYIIHKVRLSKAVRALWTTPVIDADGNIHIVTKDSDDKGRVIKLDQNLNVVWEYEVGKSLSSPVILSNGDVCVGSWDGHYYCLKTR